MLFFFIGKSAVIFRNTIHKITYKKAVLRIHIKIFLRGFNTYSILGLGTYNRLTIKTSMVMANMYMEITVVDAADGRKVVGTGTAD